MFGRAAASEVASSLATVSCARRAHGRRGPGGTKPRRRPTSVLDATPAADRERFEPQFSESERVSATGGLLGTVCTFPDSFLA